MKGYNDATVQHLAETQRMLVASIQSLYIQVSQSINSKDMKLYEELMHQSEVGRKLVNALAVFLMTIQDEGAGGGGLGKDGSP